MRTDPSAGTSRPSGTVTSVPAAECSSIVATERSFGVISATWERVPWLLAMLRPTGRVGAPPPDSGVNMRSAPRRDQVPSPETTRERPSSETAMAEESALPSEGGTASVAVLRSSSSWSASSRSATRGMLVTASGSSGTVLDSSGRSKVPSSPRALAGSREPAPIRSAAAAAAPPRTIPRRPARGRGRGIGSSTGPG